MFLNHFAEMVATNVTSQSGTDVVELCYFLPHALKTLRITTSSLSLQITYRSKYRVTVKEIDTYNVT